MAANVAIEWYETVHSFVFIIAYRYRRTETKTICANDILEMKQLEISLVCLIALDLKHTNDNITLQYNV